MYKTWAYIRSYTISTNISSLKEFRVVRAIQFIKYLLEGEMNSLLYSGPCLRRRRGPLMRILEIFDIDPEQ